jgi:23S rRNA (uridine2552-2'-O)-methyltransferase
MKRPAAKANPWEDHYARKAKKEHFPARSVYKLKEIQQKYRLIRSGDKVLDLGCSPGSWLIYAAGLTGAGGRVVGIDLNPVAVPVPHHVAVYTADILSVEQGFLGSLGKDFNAVLSDMAPATTGNRAVDAARSLRLCEAALSIAKEILLPGGSFVCKIFQGEDFIRFSDSVKERFTFHKIFKPQSSRKASREIYIIGMDKR